MEHKTNPARNYCFTYNNYPDNLEEFNERLRQYCVYSIYGKEVAPSTQTPHLQGYFQLEKKERLSGVVKKFPGCHLIVARGGYEANVEYCSKEGLCFTHGIPSIAGQRLGLGDACIKIKEGSTLSEIAADMPEVYARYVRGLEALSVRLSQQRDFKTEVSWLWGPTGTGKSRYAATLAGESAYWKPGSTKWWNGYEGQTTVIIDDYRRDLCTFAELLRLFDRYPHSVETKGGVRSFVSRRIIVTTPKSPSDTWTGRTEEDIAQLLRRIENVQYFGLGDLYNGGGPPIKDYPLKVSTFHLPTDLFEDK